MQDQKKVPWLASCLHLLTVCRLYRRIFVRFDAICVSWLKMIYNPWVGLNHFITYLQLVDPFSWAMLLYRLPHRTICLDDRLRMVMYSSSLNGIMIRWVNTCLFLTIWRFMHFLALGPCNGLTSYRMHGLRWMRMSHQYCKSLFFSSALFVSATWMHWPSVKAIRPIKPSG